MTPSEKRLNGVREIDYVFAEYVKGSRTTSEVAAMTGYSVKKVSAYSRELIRRGQMKREGFNPRPGGIRGRREVRYVPV
jgi:hypothetical protein